MDHAARMRQDEAQVRARWDDLGHARGRVLEGMNIDGWWALADNPIEDRRAVNSLQCCVTRGQGQDAYSFTIVRYESAVSARRVDASRGRVVWLSEGYRTLAYTWKASMSRAAWSGGLVRDGRRRAAASSLAMTVPTPKCLWYTFSPAMNDASVMCGAGAFARNHQRADRMFGRAGGAEEFALRRREHALEIINFDRRKE